MLNLGEFFKAFHHFVWWEAFVEEVSDKFEFGWNKIFYELEKLKIEL